MQVTDEMALRAARREANFDGYDCFEAMSRMSRERYIARSRAALEAALGAQELPLRHDIERHLAILSEKESCIEELAGALNEVLVGGNHLALLIRHGHPSANATPQDAACHYGPDIPAYDAWCCWASIMRARAVLERWGLK